MLIIDKPYITYVNDKVRLCAKLIFPHTETIAWFEADRQYEPYLVTDRADAFVVAFLTAAMKAGEDIISRAPVSKRLLFQLNSLLIPRLSQNMNRYHRMKIQAEPTDVELPCENAVGLGWTAGVDSFYSFKRYAETREPSMKITHLVVVSIGTFEAEDQDKTLSLFLNRAEDMAQAQGLQAMGIQSNIHKIVNETYLSVGAFRIPSAILAFQKLFGTFLHSSSYEYWRFALTEENSARYELLVFDCLETETTRFYSSTGDASRIDKITAVADYPPAWTRLHPCLYQEDENCGKCGKCDSVFTTLYALGKLENFAKAVDVDLVKKNLDSYIQDIVLHSTGIYKGELFRFLRDKGMLTPAQLRLARMVQAAGSMKPPERTKTENG